MSHAGLTSDESIKRRIKKDELNVIVEASCMSPLSKHPIVHESEFVEAPSGDTHLKLESGAIRETEAKPKRVLVVDDEPVEVPPPNLVGRGYRSLQLLLRDELNLLPYSTSGAVTGQPLSNSCQLIPIMPFPDRVFYFTQRNNEPRVTVHD